MSKKDIENELLESNLEIKKRGQLKIFFGISPGSGKTYSMLRAAKRDASKGINVAIGGIETHNQADVVEMLNNFDVIPTKPATAETQLTDDIDLDAIILRHPYLVIIDELAHSNAVGSRHAKRYQDIVELLDNGINVYTTLNILNLESKNDIITKITGISIQETVPDEIFEMADDVELIDVTPNTLLDRLAEGKIDINFRRKVEEKKFFRKGNIIALREMSLRLVADRVDKQLKSYMQDKHIEGPWKSGTNLLVLVGPSKSSAKLIRWAKSLSYTMKAKLVALHVENTQILNEAQQEQLTKNMDLARQFGAEIIATSGDDLVSTTLDVARRENITHIVIGKSGKQSFWSSLFDKNNFVKRLLNESGEIDIYVIEPGFEARQYKKKLISNPDYSSPLKDYLISALVIIVTVLLSLPLATKIGHQPISFILLFVILVLSMFFRLGPILLASALSAILWNFCFIPPIFAFKIHHAEDLLGCCLFFFVAFVTGSLTTKVRKQAILTKKREERTNALFHLTNHLANADSSKAIIEVSRTDIKKYFGIDVFFFLKDEQGRLKKKQPNEKLKRLTESEYEIAQWVFKYAKKAGKYTDTLSSNEYTFYPLRGTNTKPGVIVLRMDTPFSGETELFWDTFLTQISNTLEHHQFAQIAKASSFSEESAKLYKTFFKSVSSEFKTPVSTIVEASHTLLDQSPCTPETKEELYRKISHSSNHLDLTINNLLNIYLLKDGKIFSNPNWTNIGNIFSEVKERLAEDLKSHNLEIVIPETMPLVKVDAYQIKQVILNLVYNSCKYSGTKSTIRLKTFYDNGYLIIQEMDRGSGLSEELLPIVFTQYCVDKNSTANSLGIGLSIAKSFTEIHNGTISVENRENGGVRFTIKIPTEISYSNKIKD